jgi:hypothetical protein
LDALPSSVISPHLLSSRYALSDWHHPYGQFGVYKLSRSGIGRFASQ